MIRRDRRDCRSGLRLELLLCDEPAGEGDAICAACLAVGDSGGAPIRNNSSRVRVIQYCASRMSDVAGLKQALSQEAPGPTHQASAGCLYASADQVGLSMPCGSWIGWCEQAAIRCGSTSDPVTLRVRSTLADLGARVRISSARDPHVTGRTMIDLLLEFLDNIVWGTSSGD